MTGENNETTAKPFALKKRLIALKMIRQAKQPLEKEAEKNWMPEYLTPSVDALNEQEELLLDDIENALKNGEISVADITAVSAY